MEHNPQDKFHRGLNSHHNDLGLDSSIIARRKYFSYMEDLLPTLEKIDGRLKLTLLSQQIAVIIKTNFNIIFFIFINLIPRVRFFVNRFDFFHTSMSVYLSCGKRCVPK